MTKKKSRLFSREETKTKKTKRGQNGIKNFKADREFTSSITRSRYCEIIETDRRIESSGRIVFLSRISQQEHREREERSERERADFAFTRIFFSSSS